MSKRLYEEKHPETRKGASGGSNAGKARTEVAKLASTVERFTADTAKATGKSERVKCPIIGHPGGSFTVKDSA